MIKYVNSKDFAIAVVSGNKIDGDDPLEISQKALDLYLTAMAVAREHNDKIPKEKKSKEQIQRKHRAISSALGR